ncbi:MAG: hypothetical protein AABW63_01805 [Nanoarchaeota archaeon]
MNVYTCGFRDGVIQDVFLMNSSLTRLILIDLKNSDKKMEIHWLDGMSIETASIIQGKQVRYGELRERALGKETDEFPVDDNDITCQILSIVDPMSGIKDYVLDRPRKGAPSMYQRENSR